MGCGRDEVERGEVERGEVGCGRGEVVREVGCGKREVERVEEGLQTGRRGDAHNLRPFLSLQSTK